MFKKLLATEFAPYCTLSEVQLDQLENHYSSLLRWNERLNLTRILGLTESVQFHYCESLFLARSLPQGSHRIVDVGSGGGFPGIPTAILRPECEITLVESHQRKSVFLREACRELKNVRVVSKRAEDVDDVFDWLISRAVAPAQVLRLNLADSFAILIGEEDAFKLSGESERIPWGSRRVLFHVEHDIQSHGEVPRGTC
jgi:16S rRNA (guanine(527)-N(7))-methyltransferase RsmG